MVLIILLLICLFWLISKIFSKENNERKEGIFGGKNVLLFLTKEGKAPDFVRLFDNDEMKVSGSFLMFRQDLEDDLKGGLFRKRLTIEQIQHKYALLFLPKYIVDVKLPGGVNIAVGKANAVEIYGRKLNGGGRIYMILSRLQEEWFPESTVRNLDEYTKSIRTRK